MAHVSGGGVHPLTVLELDHIVTGVGLKDLYIPAGAGGVGEPVIEGIADGGAHNAGLGGVVIIILSQGGIGLQLSLCGLGLLLGLGHSGGLFFLSGLHSVAVLVLGALSGAAEQTEGVVIAVQVGGVLAVVGLQLLLAVQGHGVKAVGVVLRDQGGTLQALPVQGLGEHVVVHQLQVAIAGQVGTRLGQVVVALAVQGLQAGFHALLAGLREGIARLVGGGQQGVFLLDGVESGLKEILMVGQADHVLVHGDAHAGQRVHRLLGEGLLGRAKRGGVGELHPELFVHLGVVHQVVGTAVVVKSDLIAGHLLIAHSGRRSVALEDAGVPGDKTGHDDNGHDADDDIDHSIAFAFGSFGAFFLLLGGQDLGLGRLALLFFAGCAHNWFSPLVCCRTAVLYRKVQVLASPKSARRADLTYCLRAACKRKGRSHP